MDKYLEGNLKVVDVQVDECCKECSYYDDKYYFNEMLYLSKSLAYLDSRDDRHLNYENKVYN